jgi:hypothetical protein
VNGRPDHFGRPEDSRKAYSTEVICRPKRHLIVEAGELCGGDGQRQGRENV